MISLTRLSGSVFLLNADLIERVDCTPDTVVTLVDGTKYVVAESLEVVLGEVVDYRARIVARAPLFDRENPRDALGGVQHLTPVPAPPERPAGVVPSPDAATSTAVPTTAGRRAVDRFPRRNRGFGARGAES